MNDKILTVSQITRYLKNIIDEDYILKNAFVSGEITNYRPSSAGHLYFTIKDENAALNCVIFRFAANNINIKLKDGLKVKVHGKISVYEKGGSYQIIVDKIEEEGEGDLYKKFLMLKEKLEQEGLFDAKYKKKIPYLPNRVGVITSKTGSVIKDIINVSTRRFDNVNLLIYPAAVQGPDVPKTVIEGLKYFNEKQNVDVIIIARGGGSFEDLFGFNDENIAREIFKSVIPVVSAVGHETDTTICDLVADLRAPTPSAAAEVVYKEKEVILANIEKIKQRLATKVENFVERKKLQVENIKARKIFNVPKQLVLNNMQTLDIIQEKIKNNLQNRVQKEKALLAKLTVNLDAISPLKTLSRGYSIAISESGKTIKNATDVRKGEEIKVIVQNGEFKAEVK